MVTTTAFGNVMKQRGNVQNPGLVPACCQLRTHRVFVRMFGHEKAPYVAQHHQNMLVNRVHMKQVMLHLSDDFSENPQITPQHRGLVHQPHGVRDAFRLLQDAPEGVPVDWVTAKSAVHQAARVVQRAQGAG